MKYLAGIDEVGRGPLAGPVAVGVFLIENKILNKKEVKELFKLANDSKKLTQIKRENIFEILKKMQKSHNMRYVACYESSKIIDKKGINFAINSCIKKGLKKLKVIPQDTKIFLDGGLKAPKEFKYQETIIKGDQKNKLISLASIIAKVSRDNLMLKIAKKYPNYGLEIHKGYGTSKHREYIKIYGLSSIHRITFCSKVK